MRPKNYYRNYRGRRTKGKAALAALLVLVILVAVVVILLQRHIVYDETGAPRLDVPWQEETVQENSSANLDLVVKNPEKITGEIRGMPLSPEQLTVDRAVAALEGSDCNAVVIPLKDEMGMILFETATAVAGSMAGSEERTAALVQLTKTCHVIGRISCFCDPVAADADPEAMGLMNTDGFLFYDAENHRWLDPAKPAARQYLCDLAVDAAELGVDEILLTDFCYPTEGQLEKIAYGESAKSDNLCNLLRELQTALEPYGTVLSVELPADVITAGQVETAGLILKQIAPEVDRICAVALPEEVRSLTAQVKAAEENVLFVPVLAGVESEVSGSFLLQ